MKKNEIINCQAAIIRRYEDMISYVQTEDKTVLKLITIYRMHWEIITLKMRLKKAQKSTKSK